MKKLIVLFFILFTHCAFAQVPEPVMLSLRGIGGNGDDQILTNVTKTSDGGFIIAISTNSAPGTGNIDSFCDVAGGRNIFLKYSADGSVLEWDKCSTSGSYIFPRNDGSFIFGGIATAVPSGWAYEITKEDAFGSVLWTKTYGGEAASAIFRSMIATNDGGYIMMGETNYTDTDFTTHYGSWVNADIGVIKVDSNGNKVWAKVIGGTGDERGLTIVTAPGDGCYVLATTYSNDYDCMGNHGGDDIYLVCLDKNGNILWHNDIGGSGGDRGNWMTANGKGGVIIAGASSSTDGDITVFPSFGCPIWALEVDSNKNITWNNCYGGGGGNCYANAICKATDGSIWVAGVSTDAGGEADSAYGRDDAWFVHTDSTGDFINAKVVGSHLWDRGTMVYPLSNGNVIAGGFYDTAGGSFSNNWYGGDDAFLTVFSPWTTGITQLQEGDNEIKLYPNPSNEMVTIESGNTESYDLAVTDIVGKLVYKTNFNSKIAMPVNNWQAGIYFVQVVGADGYRCVQKLIVQ